MKRGSVQRAIITRVIVFVLLGAIANIALAWGLAIWSPRNWNATKPLASDEAKALWSQYAPLDWAVDVACVGDCDRTFGLQLIRLNAWRHSKDSLQKSAARSKSWNIVAWRVGWPFPTAYCTLPYNADPLPPIELAWHMPWNVPGKRSSMIPYGPMWSGLSINTMFFAGVLWGIFGAPVCLYRSQRWWRRRRRCSRGLCPACAYPVGTSPVCTECGTSVQAQREAAPDERAGCDTAR